MWTGFRSLIQLIMAASVELFPEPVTPVTQDQPAFVVGDLGPDLRKPEVGEARHLDRDDPHHDHECRALTQDVHAKASNPRETPGAVIVVDAIDILPVVLMGDQLLHLISGEPLLGERH